MLKMGQNHCLFMPSSFLLLFLFNFLPFNFAVEGMGGDGFIAAVMPNDAPVVLNDTTVVPNDSTIVPNDTTVVPNNEDTTKTKGDSSGPSEQMKKAELKKGRIVRHFVSPSRALANQIKLEDLMTTMLKIDEAKNEHRKSPVKGAAADQSQNFSHPLASDQNSSGSSADQKPTASSEQSQQPSHHVEKAKSFSNYWKSVEKQFNENGDSPKFELKVPPKLITKTVLRMINAFLKYQKSNGESDRKKEKTFTDFPHPHNFRVHRERKITEKKGEELVDDVWMEYTDHLDTISRFYDFYYLSPELFKDKSDKMDELSIVWTFGVIMYGLLTNGEHPFEGLKDQLLRENDPYKIHAIQQLPIHYSMHVDKSGQMWGRGRTLKDNLQKAISQLMERGEEVPILYKQTMPDEFAMCDSTEGQKTVDDDQYYVCVSKYEPLISLTKHCLQTYKKNRITMRELREKLKEFAGEN